MIRNLMDLLGFLTIIPTGMPKSLEGVADSIYLFPLVGALIGLMSGAALILLSTVLPLSIAAAIGFFLLLFLTGLHHLDGLLDMGDALIIRGTWEKRINAMHDTGNGAGGFMAGLFITLLGFLFALEYVNRAGNPIVLFIVAESTAKLSMVVLAGVGRPAFKGLGSLFIDSVHRSKWKVAAAGGVWLIIVWAFIGPSFVLILGVGLLTALSMAWLSTRLIGGVSGDGFGALNEICRTFVMLVMLWML